MTFTEFAQMNGLLGPFLEDGKIHRVKTETKRHKRNGAYKWNGDWGWIQNWETHERPEVWRADGKTGEPIRRRVQVDRSQERARHEQAAVRAAAVIERCSFGTHDYFVRKGFREGQGLIDTHGTHVPRLKDVSLEAPFLVVPMRGHVSGRVQSVQWIDCKGTKLFMRDGIAEGAVFTLGNAGHGLDVWYCEGYATALSIEMAARKLYRPARVVVCFSAANLKKVAMAEAATDPAVRRYVMADHDLPRKDGQAPAGQTRAAETGLPWVMPETPGYDANDLHQMLGLKALVACMRGALT